MEQKLELTRRQKLAGFVFKSQTKFLRNFWKSDLSKPPSTRQKLFWNDESQRVLLATGRKTSKTLNIEARIIRSGITNRRRDGSVDERMFVTPGDNQMTPVWDRVLTRIHHNPLFYYLEESSQKNEGTINFRTGQKWYFRIEGSSGTDTNMIGLRCAEIVGDEMALGNSVCHRSRLQSALPTCRWMYCGVPNGVRHTPFWTLDQTEKGRRWARHKFSTFVNPLYWDPKEIESLKEDYTEGTQDYITQVMGGWGEEVFSSFPPGSMLVSERLPYRVVKLLSNDIPRELDMLSSVRVDARLNLPRVNAYEYVIGMDYGYLQDPTQIGIAYRTKEEENSWYMLARIRIDGATPNAQARFLQYLAWIIGERKIARIYIDQGNAGIAVATQLLESEFGAWWSKVLGDFAAGEMIEVDVAGKSREELEQEGLIPQEIKKVGRKQHFTQLLQASLLAARADLPGTLARLTLGKDEELVQELIDTRERKTETGRVVYLPRMAAHNQPVDHATDMLRNIIAAIADAMVMGRDNEEDMGEGWTDEPLFGQPITVFPW